MIYTDIPFTIDIDGLSKRVGAEEDDELYDLLLKLADSCAGIKPSAAILPAEVVSCDGHVQSIAGYTFDSNILDVNLKNIDTVYAYIATCGRGFDSVDVSADMLYPYWLDEIRLQAVSAACSFVNGIVKNTYGITKHAQLNPGSLPAFPISEQTKLFDMLKSESETIGVTLNDRYIMHPLKSVSGFIYASDKRYENCMLCLRENCPNRRAPYDKELAMMYNRCEGNE